MSIDRGLVNPKVYLSLKDFYQYNAAGIDINDILSLLAFIDDSQDGSNKHVNVQHCICDFEVFLSRVFSAEIKGISLRDFFSLVMTAFLHRKNSMFTLMKILTYQKCSCCECSAYIFEFRLWFW